MTKIDVHHHFLPDFYRQALIDNGHSRPDGIWGIPDWDETSALRMLDEAGITKAYLSVSSPGVHFGDAAAARALARRVNEEAARLARAHPGRFAFFASTPLPDIHGALTEIAYAFDEFGADGVLFETN
ncbi:amidohydrolase family protein [Kitasatospora sp. NPDC093550]|uniref:amidohydrolase family protein n=1 Tax=Kitasatospora sp. NPDC093550 TaxID=3364089 RepID=UPI00382DDE06